MILYTPPSYPYNREGVVGVDESIGVYRPAAHYECGIYFFVILTCFFTSFSPSFLFVSTVSLGFSFVWGNNG